MTPAELQRIVDTWGGVDKFAALLHVDRSTVYRWLDGSRAIRPSVAEFIRLLSVTRG